MDWGLGNPNKTAAIIAILMIGSWGLAYVRKWGFWVALALFTGFGICLVHTFSRGGFVALFFGLLPVLLMAPRPWPWKRIAGVVAAVWIIVGFSVYLQAHERLGQGVVQEDRSISNRLDLWKYAPSMMLDAPDGWGLGNSGRSFMEWYQPLDRHEPYRTMVNSHLTWLVEFGWLGRFLYLAAWLTILLICLPDSRSRWLAVPLGVWLSIFVSAIFSSVAEEPWVWVVPGLSLLVAIIWRISKAIWPMPASWLAPPIGAALALILIPILWQGTDVQKGNSFVIFGNQTPSVWVVVDEKILGPRYGRTLRTHEPNLNGASIGIVEDLQELPDVSGAAVILAGRFASTPDQVDMSRLASAAAIIVVNPSVFPLELAGLEGLAEKISVKVGDFAQSPSAHAWAAQFPANKMTAVGDFVPDWPTKLLQENCTP